MTLKRQPASRDDDPRRRQLHEWFAAVMGPTRRLQKKEIDFVCQVSDRLFLFLSDESRGRQRLFYMLDTDEGTLEPFEVPALKPHLVREALYPQTLRYDGATATYFFCSENRQMREPGFLLIRAAGRRGGTRTFTTAETVSSIFVTGEHVYLLDGAGEKLTRMSKAKLLAWAFETEGQEYAIIDPKEFPGRKRTSDIHDIPVGDRLAGDGPLYTAFSANRLIFWRPKRFFGEFPTYPKLHAFDFAANRFEEHCFPSFIRADFGRIVEWAVNDHNAFEKYLALLSLYEADPSNEDELPLFFAENGLLFDHGGYRPCHLEVITEEKVAEFADLVGFRFGKLMSEDRGEIDDGIIRTIDAPLAFSSDDEIDFVREKVAKGRIETAEWDKLAGDRVDPFFLDSLVKVLDLSEGRVALAKRWLTRNPARQYVALVLLNGRVEAPGPAMILGDDPRAAGRLTHSRFAEIVFSSENEIPLEAVRGLAEGWLRKTLDLTALDWDELTDDQRAALEDHRALLMAVASAAIAWETGTGYDLVRWLDAQGLVFLRVHIATVIGDRNARPVWDLLGRYLAGDDADLASSALQALRHDETGDFEKEMFRWLKAADDNVPDRAAYALGAQGIVPALLPLFYSEIISIAHERPARRYRFGTQESEAIDRLLKKIFRTRWDGPPMESRLRPGEIAEMSGYAPFFMLYLASLAFQQKEELAKPSKALRGTPGVPDMIAFLKRIMGAENDWEPFDFDLLHRIAKRDGRVSELVEKVLVLFLESDIPEDTKYLLALYIVFTPNLLGRGRPGAADERIMVLLKAVLDPMLTEVDYRRTFAIFALVELGLGRERERDAVGIFRRDEWHGWPRLARLGEWALRYLPEAEKAVIYEKCLLASKSSFTVSQYAKKLVSANPKRAVELYEQGRFKLEKFNEALLYGRGGDTRGYGYILKHFTKWGDVEAIVFLGDFGGEEAIQALEKARNDHGAPEAEVAKAIRRIRKRLKAEGQRR